MNIKITKILILLIFQTISGFSQYVLRFEPDEWKINAPSFYISEVVDERKNTAVAGKVMDNGKIVSATFAGDAAAEIGKIILPVMKQQPSKVPIVLAIEKLTLNETGSIKQHKATLDFSVKFYRKFGTDRHLIYEASGIPDAVIQGHYPFIHERNIIRTFRKVIEEFNQYLIEKPDLPALANAVKVIFEDDKRFSNSARDTIAWSSDYKLRWSDFKGKPGASPFMAQSNCLFHYSATSEVQNGLLLLRMNLFACFEKNNSWKKKDSETAELLAHEQLHFDICQLNIQQLKKKIAALELSPFNFDDQIRLLFMEAWENYNRQQEAYDSETQHGIVVEKQEAWRRKIEAELSNE